VRLEEMRWEGRWNGVLEGGGGGISVPLDLQNIHRKEYCSDNITTTHPLPMSTPFKSDRQSSSSGLQQNKKEIKRH